jgi:hypothetical protein
LTLLLHGSGKLCMTPVKAAPLTVTKYHILSAWMIIWQGVHSVQRLFQHCHGGVLLCVPARKNKVVPAQIQDIQAVMLENLHASRGGTGGLLA